MTSKRILLMIDEEPFRVALAEQLEVHDEFTISWAISGDAAVEKSSIEIFDLILLDVDLGEIEGWQVCKMLRKSGVKCPIIMLMATDSDSNNDLGMNFGASDYVVKPFKITFLLARIRSHLRQHEQIQNAELFIGPYIFRPSSKLLWWSGNNTKVRLTEKESSILEYLYHAGDKAVSRTVLLDQVWGYSAGVTTHTLETHIYRLRKKLEKNSSSAKILITEPGGYRLLM